MAAVKKFASATASKRAGREYGADLWQTMLMERRPDSELDGPWTGDIDARREAIVQRFDPAAFVAGAKAEWVRAQRSWRADR